ncbi:NAD(P)H-binding protein [Actinomadura gamaensis]|uniref:NAD(P)H-binding protein n=1 Tax=Actinomadura gamaensis TaxID=1763541 RepID=A0ABV9TWP5_9ACTN
MILVTGATGTVGRELVRVLAAWGEQVRAVTRDLAKATFPDGVEAVRADFDEPATLKDAARGADAIFMLSAPGPWIPRNDAAVVAAARAAGVRRVVKLSAIGTGDHPEDRDWHLAGERALKGSGLAWTILRPSSFASNTLSWADAIRAGQPVPNTMGDGRQGVVDPADVAEVAARALVSSEHDGRTYTLTGPEAISVPQMAETLGTVVGRPVRTVPLSLDEYRERLTEAGLDPAFVTTAVEGSRLVASGGNERVTDDVERVLGRPPRSFADWAGAHRAAFAG